MTAILLAPVAALMVVWGFMGIAFWVLLSALIVLLVRGTRATAPDSGGPVVRLLEERYARGEITREDFVERRAVLGRRFPEARGDDSG